MTEREKAKRLAYIEDYLKLCSEYRLCIDSEWLYNGSQSELVLTEFTNNYKDYIEEEAR